MNYQEKIIDRIKNPDSWPTPERQSFLEELSYVADKSFDKKTIEGYLAALLIYHQLTEEFMKILIECSRFYMQLLVFPSEINIKKSKNKMFGQVINDLEHGVIDEDIKLFIKKSKELNLLRINMVHKLTLKSSLNIIEKQ